MPGKLVTTMNTSTRGGGGVICLFCSNPTTGSGSGGGSHKSPTSGWTWNENFRFRHAVKTIFEKLLIPSENFEHVLNSGGGGGCGLGFCGDCSDIVEGVQVLVEQIQKCELLIQSKAEKVGQLVKGFKRPRGRANVIWDKFKEPVIKNYASGLLPNNPRVVIRNFEPALKGRKVDVDLPVKAKVDVRKVKVKTTPATTKIKIQPAKIKIEPAKVRKVKGDGNAVEGMEIDADYDSDEDSLFIPLKRVLIKGGGGDGGDGGNHSKDNKTNEVAVVGVKRKLKPEENKTDSPGPVKVGGVGAKKTNKPKPIEIKSIGPVEKSSKKSSDVIYDGTRTTRKLFKAITLSPKKAASPPPPPPPPLLLPLVTQLDSKLVIPAGSKRMRLVPALERLKVTPPPPPPQPLPPSPSPSKSKTPSHKRSVLAWSYGYEEEEEDDLIPPDEMPPYQESGSGSEEESGSEESEEDDEEEEEEGAVPSLGLPEDNFEARMDKIEDWVEAQIVPSNPEEAYTELQDVSDFISPIPFLLSDEFLSIWNPREVLLRRGVNPHQKTSAGAATAFIARTAAAASRKQQEDDDEVVIINVTKGKIDPDQGQCPGQGVKPVVTNGKKKDPVRVPEVRVA